MHKHGSIRRRPAGPGPRASLPAQRSAFIASALAILVLAGCASPGPDRIAPAPEAPRWQATLPHEGDLGTLRDWWSRFDDPLLPALVQHAQLDSPTLAQALARVRQARAAQRAAESGTWPGLTGQLGATRQSDASSGFDPVSQLSGTLQAQWEIDLFGAVRHGVEAAQARRAQAEAGWHDARVSLAAEVAQGYLGLRGCEALLEVYRQSEVSQRRSAELTREKLRVGFESPANAALADGAAAQARERVSGQRAECEVAVKSLVALTGLDEPGLREQLSPGQGRLPAVPALPIEPIPAAVLAQRPDLAAAERELVAAAADVGVAEARRWPQLNLSGSIGGGWVRLGSQTEDALTWSFGPSLTVPIFDAGRRRADRDAAMARYDEARAAFEGRLRSAVREVEEALVRLGAAADRLSDARQAAEGYREYHAAVESRWRVGAGSLIDLEEARRLSLDAQAVLLGVQLERESAWVRLYRAAGGGWQPGDPSAPAGPPDGAGAAGVWPVAGASQDARAAPEGATPGLASTPVPVPAAASPLSPASSPTPLATPAAPAAASPAPTSE